MAMSLSTVKKRTKVVVVNWEEETVKVSYRPAAMTPRIMEEVSEAAAGEDLKVLGKLLEPVLDWWDVLDDDGDRIPPTEEAIKDFPVGFLMAVMAAIQKDGEPEGKGPSTAG